MRRRIPMQSWRGLWRMLGHRCIGNSKGRRIRSFLIRQVPWLFLVPTVVALVLVVSAVEVGEWGMVPVQVVEYLILAVVLLVLAAISSLNKPHNKASRQRRHGERH
jgi:hypothetical protein